MGRGSRGCVRWSRPFGQDGRSKAVGAVHLVALLPSLWKPGTAPQPATAMLRCCHGVPAVLLPWGSGPMGAAP